MTLRFFGGYLGGRFFYQISSTGSVDGVPIDNPDQRIAQDIDKFTEQSSELFFELVDSCVSAASFAVVLITIDAWILLYVVIFAVIFNWAYRLYWQEINSSELFSIEIEC